MDKVEEARAALKSEITKRSGHSATYSLQPIMDAADAYARAARLQGHVGVCEEWSDKNVPVPEGMVSAKGQPDGRMPVRDKRCGDGWLCDGAREIEELGK